MNNLKQLFLGACLASLVAAAAQAAPAATVTFDGLTASDYENFTSYTEAGFTFTLLTGLGASQSHIGDGTYASETLNWHDGGDNGEGAYVRMTRADNATFSLLSFEFATQSPGHTFSLAGSGGQTLSLIGASDGFNESAISSAYPGWTGLSYVNFYANGSGAQIDNLNVALTSAVPEPETYAMLLCGLAAVGFVAKRRKR